MKLGDHYQSYLERMSRRMTKETGKKITARMVLEAVLDLAIADEGLFDPEDPGQPLSGRRREVVQAERQSRTVRLEPHELVQLLLGHSAPGDPTDDEPPEGT